MDSMPFPRLSKNTIEAAEAAFGARNVYVVIGNVVNTLFANIDLVNLYPEEGVAKEFPYLLCLVTIFQFNEGIADHQAAEATRVRTDWKYALHLPVNYPGLSADALCDFRQRLLKDVDYKAKVQHVLAQLEKTGYLSQGELASAKADIVLQSVCTSRRLELVASAMRTALQTLIATRSEWLRPIVPPHWYQRYSQNLSRLQLPHHLEGQVEQVESIGGDGWYLLKAIAQANSTDLAELVEIQKLKQIWNWQFELCNDLCKLRVADCASCMDKLRNHYTTVPNSYPKNVTQ